MSARLETSAGLTAGGRLGVFDRIVCGADGSTEAVEAVRQAKRLLVPDGRLIALVVSDVREASLAGWSAPELAAQLRQEADEAAAEAAEELAGLPNAQARVVIGSPAGRLLAAVQDERATLVALGSHGLSRAAGIVLGGVATTLLHDAPCSVLLARPAVDSTRFPHQIVAGVDGSPESLAAAAAAQELAVRFGSSLRLVAATGGKPVDVEGLVRLRVERAALEWSELPPLEALLEASGHADLLVVGSRGLHGVAALGSVSERVAHRARCSVLVVREGG